MQLCWYFWWLFVDAGWLFPTNCSYHSPTWKLGWRYVVIQYYSGLLYFIHWLPLSIYHWFPIWYGILEPVVEQFVRYSVLCYSVPGPAVLHCWVFPAVGRCHSQTCDLEMMMPSVLHCGSPSVTVSYGGTVVFCWLIWWWWFWRCDCWRWVLGLTVNFIVVTDWGILPLWILLLLWGDGVGWPIVGIPFILFFPTIWNLILVRHGWILFGTLHCYCCSYDCCYAIWYWWCSIRFDCWYSPVVIYSVAIIPHSWYLVDDDLVWYYLHYWYMQWSSRDDDCCCSWWWLLVLQFVVGEFIWAGTLLYVTIPLRGILTFRIWFLFTFLILFHYLFGDYCLFFPTCVCGAVCYATFIDLVLETYD